MVAIHLNGGYNEYDLSFIWWFGFMIGSLALGVAAPGAFYLTDLSNKQARHAENMILFKLIALDFSRLIFRVN